jgi:serine/threonine-protein kinase
LTRVTFHPDVDVISIWTPDGKSIAFASATTQGPPDLFWKAADGTDKKKQLAAMDHAQFPTCWSNDARVLLFTDEHPDTKFDIWFLSMETGKPQAWLNTKFNETGAVFSRDGKWVAYQSDESGRYEVYVRPFGNPGGREQISTEGGTEPLWAPDKRKLFYRNGDKMMMVEVETDSAFTAAKPKLLFEGQFETHRIAANYDITNDGRRFLMIRSEKESAPKKLQVVLNWSEEVKRTWSGRQ